MANFKQMRFICDCGSEASKLIANASRYDKDEYPVCCDKTMNPVGIQNRYDGHYVVGDIEPYKSIMDGEVINSRSKHRDHLVKHDVIEVGNEDLGKHCKKPGYQKGDLRERLIHNIGKHYG